jgi:hypothetical protein
MNLDQIVQLKIVPSPNPEPKIGYSRKPKKPAPPPCYKIFGPKYPIEFKFIYRV